MNYITEFKDKQTGEVKLIRDTTIVVNGNQPATDEITKIKIRGVEYGLQDGTIEANGSSAATETLKTLTVGDKTYKVSGGSGEISNYVLEGDTKYHYHMITPNTIVEIDTAKLVDILNSDDYGVNWNYWPDGSSEVSTALEIYFYTLYDEEIPLEIKCNYNGSIQLIYDDKFTVIASVADTTAVTPSEALLQIGKIVLTSENFVDKVSVLRASEYGNVNFNACLNIYNVD